MNDPASPLQPLPPPVPSRWKWLVCGMLLAASTLNYMDRMALNQSAADIVFHFNLTNTEYGKLESVFAVAFGIGAFVFGWIVDRVGVYWIYPLVVTVWSFAGFMTGFVPTFMLLLLCRFCLGLFEAGNWPCGIVTVKRVFPPEQRSLGNGFFQGGTALGAIITPVIILACLNFADPDAPRREGLFWLAGGTVGGEVQAGTTAWRLPFQVIGILGLVWVFFWFCIARKGPLAVPPAAARTDAAEQPWYVELFRNHRFWLLVLVIMAVNCTWHSVRAWMPLFLMKGHGYSREAMNVFSTKYYIAAEVGSLSVGIGTMFLARRGLSVHGARMVAFFTCGMLVLLSIAAALETDRGTLEVLLLLIAVGSLGLFPTYFALSQEVSSKHQGKVTGTLGCLNALFLAGLQLGLGKLVDVTQDYSAPILLAGVPPLLAWLAVLTLWNKKTHS